QPISIIIDEDGEIPADPRVRFDQKAINIYADSWRVGEEA
ncbi:MAG: ABC transporter ATP-binding protein, partial [Rhizobium giardinii]